MAGSSFSNEKWVRIEINVVENPPHYEVSNFGRLRSFQNNPDGKILKGSVIQGYRSLNIRLPKGKSFNRYIYINLLQNIS